MSADLLALLDRDPAAGILAVADLREQRAKAAGDFGPWSPLGSLVCEPGGIVADVFRLQAEHIPRAEHIAAEANPAHALAAVAHWRGVVDRHEPIPVGAGVYSRCMQCAPPQSWPCFDLTETADEALAYLGGG